MVTFLSSGKITGENFQTAYFMTINFCANNNEQICNTVHLTRNRAYDLMVYSTLKIFI